MSDRIGTPHPSGAARRSSWRSVAIPSEHGGWSLTIEPCALALIVASSTAGWLLACAALLAFVARTPVELVLVDLGRHRRLPRTRLAARFAVAELTVLACLVAAAAVSAGAPFWPPLVAALPLVATEVLFGMRSRSRRLLPELAGAVGIGSVAAAIALAGGAGGELAAGLWIVVAARVCASIPFVRYQLARRRGRPAGRGTSDAAQLSAVVLVAATWLLGWLPAAVPAIVALLAVVQVVQSRLPAPVPAALGAQQTVYGLTVVLVTALAVLAGTG